MCKRPSLGASERVRERPAPVGARLVNVAVGVGTLASIAAAVVFGFDLLPAETPSSTPQLVAEPAQRSAASQAARASESVEAAKKLAAEIAANEAQLQLAQQQLMLQAQQAQPIPQQQPTTASAQDERAMATQLPDPHLAQKAKAARRQVSIVMYSTSWCPSCTKAREYMNAQGIAFTEHDVDKSESAKLIMHRLNPKHSIPTIDIDGAVLVGFSDKAIEDAIDDAAEKRAARL
jgi:glutaredoxin